MRRGSATIYSILNTSHVKAQNNNISKNQTPFHLHNSPIKKAASLNSNINHLIKVLKKNSNIKSKFIKDVKNIQINNEEKKYNKINNNNFQNISSIRTNFINKFISFRKDIYKKAIIDKYLTPYLKLNSLKNEIYTKESEKPRLFHIYLINYILQNKKCKLCSKYNEIIKSINNEDYLIIFYNMKQISYIIKYLLGCIYNQDIYTFNQNIDNWNNYESIIINYKTTKENIINNYISNQKDKSNFMLKQYISKINNVNYKYFINNINYKYLFIDELPIFCVPNIIPNYSCFGVKIIKLLKNYIYKYKFNKIKTKYNMIINNKKANRKKEIEEINKMISNSKDSDSFDIDNIQQNLHYDTEFYENYKKSFSNRVGGKNSDKTYFFSSSESEDEYLFSNLLENKKNENKYYLLFSKNKKNYIDKRIKNDGDILEVEKILDNFSSRKMNKSKTKKKSKIIENKNIIKNNFITNNIITDNIIKLFHNIKEPKQKLNIDIDNISKEKNQNFPLVIKNICKNKNIIESYNDKTNINNKKKNKNEFISLSYNNQKRIK